MSDYFRHARIVSRSLGWVRKAAPVPVAPNLGLVARRHPLRRSRAGGAVAAAGSAPSRRRSITAPACRTRRSRASSSTSVASAPTTSSATTPTERRSCALLTPRPGLYARLSEMHDCGLLGRMLPEFKAIAWRVVRDFYHKYTVDEHTLLTIRNLERLPDHRAPDRAALPRPARRRARARSCWCSRCCCTTSGKWSDEDHALESVRMAEGVLDRLHLPPTAARDGAVPDPPAPADVARRLPARHRGSRDRPAVRGVRRHRGAAEDALPADARRRRGGRARRR